MKAGCAVRFYFDSFREGTVTFFDTLFFNVRYLLFGIKSPAMVMHTFSTLRLESP